MARRECIIVASLDPITSEYLERIPRHMTVVSWFSIDEECISELNEACKKIVEDSEALSVKGLGEADYGPNGEVRVRLVEKTDVLIELHQNLLSTVLHYGGNVRRAEYAGEGYSPHVSKWSDGYLEEGEVVTLPALQFVQAVEQHDLKRCVIAQWSFGGGQ